jgi:TolA-binding protein
MGFGLHTGWAIEGSIGSKVKVDASYLSSHVNLASRLEAATKQYRVPLLMSDAFVSGLSGSIQSTCRRVDRVTFKGSSEPMTIYYQDTEPFQNLKMKPDNYGDLMTATSWENKEEIEKLGIDLTATLKALQSDKNLLIRDVYDVAFNAYLDGEWGKSKVLFHLWLEKFPGDTIIQLIVNYLMSHNFECPKSWAGFHILSAK